LKYRASPGVYRAVAFLRLHFQLEELTVSLRLVARDAGSGQIIQHLFQAALDTHYPWK
jgi:EvpB/VC_A0108, tail sheath gpW/gp25-like domain